MAIYTQLSPSATPGRRYTFVAKDSAVGTHEGLFTELSVTATPGGRHSFQVKTSAGEVVHEGLFTELWPNALPGGIHAFTAKTAAEEVEEAVIEVTGGGDDTPFYLRKKRKPTKLISDIHRDDEEILELIVEMIVTGVFE